MVSSRPSPPKANSKSRLAAKESLTSLTNLGPRSASFLASAGIKSFEELESLGSVAAFAKVKKAEPKASLNLLWALEGALTGLHWREVAKEHRTSLLLALESREQQDKEQNRKA